MDKQEVVIIVFILTVWATAGVFYMIQHSNDDVFIEQTTFIPNNFSVNESDYNKFYPLYPNKTLTPGDVMNNNLTEICESGYSSEVRDVSEKTKDLVYISYGVDPNPPKGEYQIDHLIPLSLGGSNSIRNLWAQPDDYPGYLEKTKVGNYYLKLVCNNSMGLYEAQSILANDWYSGYVQLIELGVINDRNATGDS